MPTRHPILAVLAALAVAAALFSGCSSAKQSSAPLPDAATLIKESTQSTKNVKSVHLVLTVNGTIEHLPVKTLTGDLTTTPATAASGDGTIAEGGINADVKFVVDNGELYASFSGGNWADFGPAAKVYDLSAVLDPNKGLANVLSNFSDPKSQSRETVAGENTIRITGTVSPDAVNKLASQLNATTPLPATVWIQESGAHQLVQAQLEKSPGNSIQMTLSKWNVPVQVTKPPVAP